MLQHIPDRSEPCATAISPCPPTRCARYARVAPTEIGGRPCSIPRRIYLQRPPWPPQYRPKEAGSSPSGAGEELADDPQEAVQAVVMQPVARPLDADDLRVAKRLCA